MNFKLCFALCAARDMKGNAGDVEVVQHASLLSVLVSYLRCATL